jgi:AcrR family transcriptional regulator
LNAKTRSASAQVTREAAAGRRRDSIFMALHDCIIDQGYARTSLADVARTAGMSPSHLLYYFPGKDAILAQYFAHVTNRIINRLESFRSETPDRQVQLLATLFFAGRGITKAEIGFMLECFGVAVHDPELRRQKTELDRYCKAYMRELFEQSPCGPAKAAESAEVAYALLVGLRTAAYFDERLGPQQALEIFRGEMLSIANSTRTVERRPRTRTSNGAVRKNGRPAATRL